MTKHWRELLARVRAVETLGAVVIASLFALGAVFPHLLSDYALQIGFRTMLYIVLAEAWNLLAGYCGLVSLGSACFVGIGAYVLVGLLNATAVPIGLAVATGGAAGAALVLRAGAPGRRARCPGSTPSR